MFSADHQFSGYVSDVECLAILFPNEQSRISIRKFKYLQAAGRIPHLKLGRRTFYNPVEVRLALDKQFHRKAALWA